MCRTDQLGVSLRTQPEGVGQEANGLGPGRRAPTALEYLDAARTQSRALGQRFLGQSGGDPAVTEQRPE